MHVEHTGGDRFRVHIDRKTLTAIRWALYHHHMASLESRVEGKRPQGIRLLDLVDEIEREFHRIHEEQKRREANERAIAELLGHLNRYVAESDAAKRAQARKRAARAKASRTRGRK